MITSVNNFLSASGKSMKRSAIREILRHIQKSGMISFAGSSFFCNNSGHNTMHINFSFSNEEEIETGVQRLSQVICDELKCK
jgi:DNA-binding transcriptional MocR family regulator